MIGIDETRPPKMRKEPYIDLFFKLSEKAPELWCENFNQLTQKSELSVKIDKSEGLFIETYVRDMKQIVAHLDSIKQKVQICNAQFAERLRQQTLADDRKNASLLGETGQQGQLNKIIAELDFTDPVQS